MPAVLAGGRARVTIRGQLASTAPLRCRFDLYVSRWRPLWAVGAAAEGGELRGRAGGFLVRPLVWPCAAPWFVRLLVGLADRGCICPVTLSTVADDVHVCAGRRGVAVSVCVVSLPAGLSHSEFGVQLLSSCPDRSWAADVTVKRSWTVMQGIELPDEILASLRAQFMAIDTDGSGHIEVAELRTMFQAIGDHLSDADLVRMVAEADEDHDGRISFPEFCVVRRGGYRGSTKTSPQGFSELNARGCRDRVCNFVPTAPSTSQRAPETCAAPLLWLLLKKPDILSHV